jgi:hypothetical protein
MNTRDHTNHTTRRWIRSTLAGAVAALLAVLAAPVTGESAQPTIKILIIGNEMSNGIAANVKDLYEATGRTATVVDRTLSGWTLQNHYDSATTRNKITSDDWDFILLQEEGTGIAETMVVGGVTQHRYDSVRDLKAYIDANTDAETALLMTWRNKGVALSTYDSLRGTVGGTVGYVPIAHELGIRVVPVGWTFRNLVAANSSVDLWASNNYLANGDGKYVAALTVYSALSAETVVGHYRSGITAATAAT